MYYCMDMEFVSKNSIPDFGSIKMYYVGDPTFGYVNHGKNVRLRAYTLLSKDLGKLSLITNAADGSQALIVDTGKTYILCDNEWHEWERDASNAGVTIKWNNI